MINQIVQLRKLRNVLIHDIELPDQAQILRCTEEAKALLAQLTGQHDAMADGENGEWHYKFKTGYQGDVVTYQISVPIQPGNSGGPLFDKNGNLVGITNAGVPDAQKCWICNQSFLFKEFIRFCPDTDYSTIC